MPAPRIDPYKDRLQSNVSGGGYVDQSDWLGSAAGALAARAASSFFGSPDREAEARVALLQAQAENQRTEAKGRATTIDTQARGRQRLDQIFPAMRDLVQTPPGPDATPEVRQAYNNAVADYFGEIGQIVAGGGFEPAEVAAGVVANFSGAGEDEQRRYNYAASTFGGDTLDENEAPTYGSQEARIQTDVDTTRRGQDVTAATARRGQDVDAATARRGQDLDLKSDIATDSGGGSSDNPFDTSNDAQVAARRLLRTALGSERAPPTNSNAGQIRRYNVRVAAQESAPEYRQAIAAIIEALESGGPAAGERAAQVEARRLQGSGGSAPAAAATRPSAGGGGTSPPAAAGVPDVLPGRENTPNGRWREDDGSVTDARGRILRQPGTVPRGN